MSYTYTQYVTDLSNLLVVPSNQAEFQTDLPFIIDDAEQRIYRELDILGTIVRDTGGSLTANNRNFTLPQTGGRFVVTESMNVFTPVGTTTSRNQLVPVSLEFLDAVWGDNTAPTTPSIPSYYAMVTDQTVVIAPPPDAGYTMEVVGTIRPTPLSAINPTTYLTLYLPDLFMAASMVRGSAFLKNWSAAGDDPKMAVTWEGHYQTLFASANVEEQRKRYAAQGWTSKQPAPVATPPRA